MCLCGSYKTITYSNIRSSSYIDIVLHIFCAGLQHGGARRRAPRSLSFVPRHLTQEPRPPEHHQKNAAHIQSHTNTTHLASPSAVHTPSSSLLAGF